MCNYTVTHPVYPCAGWGGLWGSLRQNWTSRTSGTSRKARSRRLAWNPRPCCKSSLSRKPINKQNILKKKHVHACWSADRPRSHCTHRPTPLSHYNRLHEIINRSILPPTLLSLVYFKALFPLLHLFGLLIIAANTENQWQAGGKYSRL